MDKHSNSSTINSASSNVSEQNNSSDTVEQPSRPIWMIFDTPCGYCDVQCVYYAIETCFTLGILANAVVLFRVIRDKRLRNPTFVSIAACALADLCFLVINLSVSFDSVILTITCNYPSKIYNSSYLTMKSISWFSANGHVTLLAILRYICLTYPLKGNAYLSIKRVILSSSVVWLLGLLIMGGLTLVIKFTDHFDGNTQEFQLVFWTATYFMPVITTGTLHIVKMYKVKKMTSETATENTKRILNTMSRMVLIVVVLATVLPFPYILDKVLKSFDPNIYGTRERANHIRRIVNIFVLLNHSINPIMYAFVSEPFRMSLKRMVRFERNTSDENLMSSMGSVTDIQKREMILKRMEC